MFKKQKKNPYGLKIGAGVPDVYQSCSPEAKEKLDKEYAEFLKNPAAVKRIDEAKMRKKIDDYEKKCVVAPPQPTTTSAATEGQGLKMAGEGLKRSGDGTVRAGTGLVQAGGCHSSVCKESKMPRTDVKDMRGHREKPKGVGHDLKQEMIKKYAKQKKKKS